MSFGGAKSVFHCIDTLVAKTRHFNVGAYFCGLRCQALADVGLELVLDDVIRESDLLPDVGIPVCGQLWGPATLKGRWTCVIDSLKASTACPYFLFKGQPMS